MNELQYLQNELQRLFTRRGDLDTVREDVTTEYDQVVASIAATRARIAQLAVQRPAAAPAEAPTPAEPKKALAEVTKLREVLAKEADRAVAEDKK